MNRREFVKQGALATAGLTLLPAGVLFAKSDATKVRLGFIGVGERGRSHISEGLLRDDVEIVAICDTQESSLTILPRPIYKSGQTSYQKNIPAASMPIKDYSIAKILTR